MPDNQLAKLADSLNLWAAQMTDAGTLPDEWIAGARAVVTELRHRARHGVWFPEDSKNDTNA